MKISAHLLTALCIGLSFGVSVSAQPTKETSTTAAALTVTVAPPETFVWPEDIHANGWLAAWQEAVVSAEISGQHVQSVNVDVGSRVQQGDVLVTLSQGTIQNELRQQEAAVQSAAAGLEEATANADRARGLNGSSAISKQQITQYLVTERQAKADLASAEAILDSKKLDLERTSILAVDDGVISSRSVALGDVITSGEELFRLIRQNRIEWQAEVPIRQVLRITKGTPVKLPVGNGDREVTGIVRQIAPTASVTSGRVIVYVALDPLEGLPAPKTGVLVSGRFNIGESSALTVPATALSMRDGYYYVYTLNKGDAATVTRARVDIGRRQDNRVEIINGLNIEAQVVQSGGAFLSSGSIVRIAQGTVKKDASK